MDPLHFTCHLELAATARTSRWVTAVTTSTSTFPRENPMSHTSFTSWPTLALVQDVHCVQAILVHTLQAPHHFVTLCSRPQIHLHCLGLIYLRKEETKIPRMNSTPQFFLQRSCALKSDHQECAPPCFVTPRATLTAQKEHPLTLTIHSWIF